MEKLAFLSCLLTQTNYFLAGCCGGGGGAPLFSGLAGGPPGATHEQGSSPSVPRWSTVLPATENLHPATREDVTVRSPSITAREQPHPPQPEKALTQRQRPKCSQNMTPKPYGPREPLEKLPGLGQREAAAI